MLWWKLVHGVLELYIERTRQLELDHHREDLGLSRSNSITVEFCCPTPARPQYPAVVIDVDLRRKCRGELHTNQDLVRPNVPIFIAASLEDPHNDKHLCLSHQTFPCIFFLGDSPQEVAQIASSRDPISGVGIGNRLVPFLDAMVVAWPQHA